MNKLVFSKSLLKDYQLINFAVSATKELLLSKKSSISSLISEGVITKETTVYALILLIRYIQNVKLVQLSSIQPLLYTCIYISHKITDDYHRHIKYFSYIFKIKSSILKSFELNVLKGLYYNTHVSKEHFYIVKDSIRF